jgi:hypothetical protein
LLVSQLDHPDSRLRTQVMHSLSRCGFHAEGLEAGKVQGQMRVEVAEAAGQLAKARDLGAGEPLALLQAALQSQLKEAVDRALYLLSFLNDSKSVLQARDNLRLPSGEKQAYALEVIDVLAQAETKKILFPLLEDLSLEQRLQRLAPSFPQVQESRQERLEQLIDPPNKGVDGWTRTCSVYAAGALSLEQLAPHVDRTLDSADPLLRETAAWAMARLEGRGGGKPVLSTIEKVIILKSVRIFAETPDEILAEVAQVLEEVEYNQDEKVFEKGDLGDSMYIIIDGKVRVHDQDNTLNFLEERDVFGEMALLDPEARVASVTAVEDTRLLRLDQEPFFELMQERIEVARGIIQVLTRYLRDRVKDLAEMRSRIEALEELAG